MKTDDTALNKTHIPNELVKSMEQRRQEIIETARKTDLAEYLLSKGVPLIRNGSRYKNAEHDSIVFTDNMYFRNKTQENGNAVDYLIKYMNYSFNGAVKELTGTDITNADGISNFNINKRRERINISSVKPFSMDSLTLETDMRRTVAYLNKTRYIDRMIIERLIDAKLLYQQYAEYRNKDGRNIEAHNILFPVYDEKKRVVGAETAGTLSYSDKRFKGVEEGSKYGYGYNITPASGPALKVYFFESAIDLISFIELENKKKNPLNNSLFVSMAGLKKSVFDNMIINFNCGDAEKYLCVDNDAAGKNFTDLIKNDYGDIKSLLPNGCGKDWNEQLKDMKIHNTNTLDDWKAKVETEKVNNTAKMPENSKKTPPQAAEHYGRTKVTSPQRGGALNPKASKDRKYSDKTIEI